MKIEEIIGKATAAVVLSIAWVGCLAVMVIGQPIAFILERERKKK